MTAEHWGAVAVVIASVIAYLGVRYTGRQSQRAQEISEAAEEKAVDAAAYQRARDSYEAAISTYQREVSRLETRVSALTDRIDRLNNDVRSLEKDRAAQRVEMERNVAELLAVRSQYETHLTECRRTVAALQAQLNEYGA